MAGKKVILLNPSSEVKYVKEGRCQHRAEVFQSVYPPLSLAYLASILKDRNEVWLVDAMADGRKAKDIEDLARSVKPDWIIGNISTPTVESDLAFLDRVRSVCGAKVAVFGVHASYFARDLVKDTFVDVVIRGEPEFVVKDLIERGLEEVRGITYKRGGEVVSNGDAEPIDPDLIPFPAWDKVDLDLYRMPIVDRRYVMLATARGCPFNCGFCVSPFYYGHGFRSRSVNGVVAEMEYAISLGISDFFMYTETFTLNRDFVISLCDEIISRNLNIKWVCNSRVDTIDADMVKKMRSAGCWMMSFGIESASQKILDSVSKGFKKDAVAVAIRATARAGILTIGHFILGLPGETEESIEETIRFALELPLDFAKFYIATPFPGSRLYDAAPKKPASWRSFDYSTNMINQALDLRKYQSQANRRFYLRPLHGLRVVLRMGLGNLPSLMRMSVGFLRSL